MRKYSECLTEARYVASGMDDEQVIQIANGMYYSEHVVSAIKASFQSIENRLFQDSQGYKGLQTVLHELSKALKRTG